MESYITFKVTYKMSLIMTDQVTRGDNMADVAGWNFSLKLYESFARPIDMGYVSSHSIVNLKYSFCFLHIQNSKITYLFET